MYLKRLELQGFKSFADKTVLEFMPGITTVIGPNGSGKSNISDAIRWVLGEQSMKTLRGAKSEDIIFAGTQNRKSLGFAETSIVIDNSDGKLPIEYTEVTVTRRLYRSGESGYFINKAPCRLKDVAELFMDTGIGKDGYSIISQGKIDEILSNKSEDRRHIFEEAAGIVKYRTRKQETEKKLEQTKLNLLRINDILSEIEGNIEPLKLQSEKAKKFLDLREELKSIEIGLFIYQIENFKQKLNEATKDLDIYTSQNEDEQKKLNEIQATREVLKQEIDDITTKIEQIQNLNVESTKAQEKLNSDINVFQERMTNNNENDTRFKQEVGELKNRNEILETEKAQKLEKKSNLTDNKEKFETELQEKETELQSILTKLSTEEVQIEENKQKIQKNIDLKYEKSSQVNTQKVNLENLEKREKIVKEDIRVKISEIDQARMDLEEISKAFREIENKKEGLQNNIEEISIQKQESEIKIKEYDYSIQKLTSEWRIKDSRHKFLIETEREKEGYTRSVKALLTECENDSTLAKGINGVLANLISLPKEYETAIEMCLGATLQNIVTDTESDAKKLIEYLRTKNLGRASFLPISSMKGKKIDKVVTKGLNGVIGVASDLINVDKKYEQILLNLLGRTVIVDNMDTAITLAKQNNNSFRIVTLKGDIINSTGSITGGSVQQKTVNILGRTREIEELQKELEKLNNDIKRINQEKESYIGSIEGTLELATGLERELQEVEIEYATSKEKHTNMQENTNRLELVLNKLKHEISQIEVQKQETVQQQQQIEQEICSIEQETQELNEVVNKFVTKNRENQKYIDDLNFEITNLRISVSSFDESENSLGEFIARIDSEIQLNNNQIDNKNKTIEKLKEENQKLEDEIIKVKEEIIKIQTEVLQSGDKTESLKLERQEKSSRLNQIEGEVNSQFSIIEDIKSQITKTEVRKSKIEFELEQVTNKMWEEYEITPNNAEGYKKPENIQEVQKTVNNLRNSIRDLGSINVDSIQEYKQTKERYDFVCEQRFDLETSSSKLRKIIQDMTNIMKEQFEEQFKIINKNFSEVFIELFGGGKAELILTDKDNILESGIEIEVQPPGKKLQNMMLLSGGERAFTAIALLFAILKINPAPFCVLDEIEAALDDANVYRFAEYLKKFADYTQFLVITHRKGTMEVANTVYGITMEENGISKLLSIKLK